MLTLLRPAPAAWLLTQKEMENFQDVKERVEEFRHVFEYMRDLLGNTQVSWTTFSTAWQWIAIYTFLMNAKDTWIDMRMPPKGNRMMLLQNCLSSTVFWNLLSDSLSSFPDEVTQERYKNAQNWEEIIATFRITIVYIHWKLLKDDITLHRISLRHRKRNQKAPVLQRELSFPVKTKIPNTLKPKSVAFYNVIQQLPRDAAGHDRVHSPEGMKDWLDTKDWILFYTDLTMSSSRGVEPHSTPGSMKEFLHDPVIRASGTREVKNAEGTILADFRESSLTPADAVMKGGSAFFLGIYETETQFSLEIRKRLSDAMAEIADTEKEKRAQAILDADRAKAALAKTARSRRGSKPHGRGRAPPRSSLSPEEKRTRAYIGINRDPQEYQRQQEQEFQAILDALGEEDLLAIDYRQPLPFFPGELAAPPLSVPPNQDFPSTHTYPHLLSETTEPEPASGLNFTDQRMDSFLDQYFTELAEAGSEQEQAPAQPQEYVPQTADDSMRAYYNILEQLENTDNLF